MKLTLTAKQHLVDNVWQFRFESTGPITWEAGQFMRADLPHAHPDAEGTQRRFTIAAAPHEPLTITTRLTATTFKAALAALPIGGRLTLLDAPAGDFVWRPAASPLVFAAQGIGITPFYAIISDRRHRGLPVHARLIYATRPGSAPVFAAELAAWAAADPTFELIHHTGILTPETLAQLVPGYADSYVYVSGPKSFVRLCAPPFALPINRLIQDNFPGYAAGDY